MDNFAELAKSGSLPSVEIQQPIERVPDMAFLNSVVTACLRPEPSRRPTAEELLKALNGALDKFDGMRPGSSTVFPTTVSPTPATILERETAPPPLPVDPPKPSSEPLPAPATTPPPRTAATPPTHPPISGSAVELCGPGGSTLKASIPTKFGRNHLKRWGEDFEKFMSPEQFHLFRDTSGNWMVEHCAYAKNMTNADGNPLSGPIPVRDGMVLSLGKTGKCEISLKVG
jgi:hypothetical protein